MPVSSQQREAGVSAIRLLESGELENIYSTWSSITPKGYRGSLLKIMDFPTAWAVLYGLSPAQISQNREQAMAENTFASTGVILPIRGEVKFRLWIRLLGAYFAGNPEPMSEANFPRWRKPSWMTDAQAEELRNFISASYQAEAPLATTMPVEDVPREQRMADLAEQEEAEAVQIEEEQAEEQNDGGRSLIDNLYALYQPYWRRSHNVESEGDLYNRRGNIDIRRALIAILTLEKLGYGHRGIKDFTNSMQQRGLQIFGLRRASRSGYNAYLLVDLKGANANASRYRSSTGYGIMGMASRIAPGILKQQFEPGQGPALQIMRFTRRGNSLAGFQVLSLNVLNGERNAMTMQEGNRQFSTANNESIAQLDAATTATGTTIQPPEPTVEGAETRFYFMGSQAFSPGMTYRQEAQLFYDVEGLNLTSDERSYAFYFVSPQNGEYKLYRSVFSPMRLAVNSLVGLKEAWSDSGQLSEPRKLKLVEISDVQNKRRLRQMFLQAHDNTNAYVSSMMMRPVRSSNMQTSVDFEVIKRIGEIQPAFTDYLRGLVGQSSSEQADRGEDIRAEVKSKKMDRTFGYEIEGNFLSALDSDPTTNDLNKREARRILTKNITEVLDERGINEMEFRRRFMINPESVQEEYRVMANGYGSIDLMGDISVAGGNAFEVASPVFIPPNDEKSKSGISRRISSAQYEAQQFKSDADMWKWVAVFSEALLRSQVQIHKSAGLHIHVSIEDYNTDDKKRYLENYAGFEPLIDLMMPINSRVGGRSFNSSIIQQDEIRSGGYTGGSTPQDSPRNWRNTGQTGRSKVRTETGKGTIEFRHPMSNIENDYIHHMVELAYRLVEVSKSYQFTSFKWKDLSSILPTETATFLYNRIEDMAMPKFESREAMRKFFKNNEPIRARYGGEKSTGSELKRRNLQ